MRRGAIRRWRHGAALLLLAMFGCAKSVVEPTTVVEPPQIVCPAPQTGRSLTGGPAVVTFSPTTTLGAEPVTTVCTPPSGTSFAIGTTAVTCTATDARQRVASCSFSVTVEQPPRLSVTRFVAFGDSMTWGEDGSAFTVAPFDLSVDRPTV
ncbi:MAG: HYR domain-containing protein, partial [Vicinamibacterales bacterium]